MLKSYHWGVIAPREYIIYERFSLINLWNILKAQSFYFSRDLRVLQILSETWSWSLMRSQFPWLSLWNSVRWQLFPSAFHESLSVPMFALNLSFFPSFVSQLHTDLDNGDSAVKYTLSGDGAGSIFTIDQTTGDIHALRSLDREEKPYYTLRAQAVDINTNRPLEPESEFVIKVQDINDNEPKFLEGPYRASVPEMSPVGKWSSIATWYRDEEANTLLNWAEFCALNALFSPLELQNPKVSGASQEQLQGQSCPSPPKQILTFQRTSYSWCALSIFHSLVFLTPSPPGRTDQGNSLAEWFLLIWMAMKPSKPSKISNLWRMSRKRSRNNIVEPQWTF